MELEGFRMERDGQIANLVIDRPPVNAVSTAMYESLIEACKAIDADQGVDVVILSSANEKIFCAGADIRELEEIVNSGSSAMDERRQGLAREAYDRFLNLAQPTIGVVGGIALGAGAVLAACCDLRVGSTRAKIGLTEINVARCGGGRHMMRLLPQGVVRRMYFTGEPLGAETLLRLGVFEDLCESGTELEVARALAAKIAAKSPLALRIAKRSLNRCEPESIATGYPVEQEFTLELARSADAAEAARAFLEKREPVWVGA